VLYPDAIWRFGGEPCASPGIRGPLETPTRSATDNKAPIPVRLPGNRRARNHRAAGSAGETRVALEVAVAWGYITEAHAASALQTLDRVVGMLWRVSRGP
jgi:hypothetical protein